LRYLSNVISSDLKCRIARHFREDNEAQKRQKSDFSHCSQANLAGPKPLSVGEYIEATTTCSGDKKYFQKSYDNVIRRIFIAKMTGHQLSWGLFTIEWMGSIVDNSLQSGKDYEEAKN
jgi:hypothetical protein